MGSRSFRLKITLLTVLLSGIIGIGFSVFFLGLIYNAGLQQIDNEIRSLGETQLRVRPNEDIGRDFEKSLEFVFGQNRSHDFILKSFDGFGLTIYTSPHWPEDISEDDLPLPDILAEEIQPRRPPPDRDRGPDGRRRNPPPQMRDPILTTIDSQNASWRFGVMGHDHGSVVIGYNLSAFKAQFFAYVRLTLLTMPFALIMLAAVGWILSRRALKPVHVIAATAERLTAQDLDARIPALRSDREFEHLIEVINNMLERLERSFNQAARFSADAAHELKTPLTILQGQLEQAIQEAPEDSGERTNYADLLEEVQRLKSITQKLLLLSQADAGRMSLTNEPVNLTEQVLEVAEDAEILAPHCLIKTDVEPGVQVRGDPVLVAQVLRNLLTNAVKYNQPEGKIEINLETQNGHAVLSMANTGTPVPEEDQERIFDRFYRVNKSRNRNLDGAGLGLSLSREIVMRHNGSLTLEPYSEGMNRFKMVLPIFEKA